MGTPRSLLANLLFAVRSRVVVGGGDICSYIIIHCIVTRVYSVSEFTRTRSQKGVWKGRQRVS